MAENMLGKSFVRLDAILKGAESSDTDIVRAARVSTGRHLEDVTDEKLKGMVNFLYRDHHLTPFQKIVFRFHVKASIRTARQFFCVLFSSHNEFSGRYSVFPENDFYVPSLYSPGIQEIVRSSQNRAYKNYRNLLEAGVAKEQARLALPYSFFTQFYWTVDLRTLFEFFDAAEVNQNCATEDFQTLLARLKEIVAEQAPVAYETYQRWNDENQTRKCEWAAVLKSRVGPSDKRCEKEKILGGFVGLREISGDAGMIVKCLSDRFSPDRALDQMIVHWDLEVPIFVWRQLVRHRKGYPAEIEDDFEGALERQRLYIPAIFRSQKGKVGHYEFEIFSGEENLRVWRILNDSQEKSIEEAKRLLEETGSLEDASLLLPYAFYTHVSWVTPLSSLTNVFLLRLDSHTQWETGQYVRAMYCLFKAKEPLLAEIIENYFWPKFWRSKSFPLLDRF